MTDPLFARFGREFAAGDVLFNEGESGREMFVIQNGVVQLTKRVGEAQRAFATLGRGEFLGEMAILNDRPRSATAVVLEDARCLVIDSHTLETMIARNGEIAMRLVKKLARRLDAADDLIQILMNPDPKARVLLSIRRAAETFGQAVDGGVKIALSAATLAEEAGVEPKHVAEVLARLRRLRVVVDDASEPSHAVVDLSRLLEFLEFLEMPKKFEAEH